MKEVVSFHGQEIVCFKQNETVWVSMRHVCDGMGLAWGSQYNKLMAQREKLNCLVINTVAEDGKNREMLCIPLNKLHGWLFTVNPNKVRQDIKEKVVQYQEECFQVLHDYWTKGVAINQRAVDSGNPDVLRLLKMAVAEIEEKNRQLTEAQQKNEVLALENNALNDRNQYIEGVEGSIYIREATKVFGMKEKAFRSWLKENRMLAFDGKTAQQSALEKGLFVQVMEWIPNFGMVTVPKITAKGFSAIERMLASERRPLIRS